jgi:hypothetical protein
MPLQAFSLAKFYRKLSDGKIVGGKTPTMAQKCCPTKKLLIEKHQHQRKSLQNYHFTKICRIAMNFFASF